MAKAADMDTNSANLIQSGTEIKGDVITQGNIRIDGKLTGTLDCKGKLIIGKTGELDGTVECSNAEVQGRLHASMKVNGLLSLKSTSKLLGDIIVKKLKMQRVFHIRDYLIIIVDCRIVLIIGIIGNLIQLG